MSEKETIKISLNVNKKNMEEFDKIAKGKGMTRASVINFLISEFIINENQRIKHENKDIKN